MNRDVTILWRDIDELIPGNNNGKHPNNDGSNKFYYECDVHGSYVKSSDPVLAKITNYGPDLIAYYPAGGVGVPIAVNDWKIVKIPAAASWVRVDPNSAGPVFAAFLLEIIPLAV